MAANIGASQLPRSFNDYRDCVLLSDKGGAFAVMVSPLTFTSQYLNPYLPEIDLCIKLYNGKYFNKKEINQLSVFNKARHENYMAVVRLPNFDVKPSFMKGVDMKEGWEQQKDRKVEIIFTISEIGGSIIGAILFHLDFGSKFSCVQELGIDEEYQGYGIGSILLLSSLFFAAIHGINKTKLLSTGGSIDFYIKNGFLLKIEAMEEEEADKVHAEISEFSKTGGFDISEVRVKKKSQIEIKLPYFRLKRGKVFSERIEDFLINRHAKIDLLKQSNFNLLVLAERVRRYLNIPWDMVSSCQRGAHLQKEIIELSNFPNESYPLERLEILQPSYIGLFLDEIVKNKTTGFAWEGKSLEKINGTVKCIRSNNDKNNLPHLLSKFHKELVAHLRVCDELSKKENDAASSPQKKRKLNGESPLEGALIESFNGQSSSEQNLI